MLDGLLVAIMGEKRSAPESVAAISAVSAVLRGGKRRPSAMSRYRGSRIERRLFPDGTIGESAMPPSSMDVCCQKGRSGSRASNQSITR